MLNIICQLIIVGSEVVLRYQGINQGQEALFVAHLVRDVKFKQYPNSAYAALSADGNHLNLTLGNSPLPFDIEVEYGVPAFYIKLQVQERIQGEIRLDLPVKEWDAFHLLDTDVKSELVSVSDVTLNISVISESKAKDMEMVKGAPGYLRVSGPPTLATCRTSSNSPIGVLKRIDNIPRL
jgi:hypothetical protein